MSNSLWRLDGGWRRDLWNAWIPPRGLTIYGLTGSDGAVRYVGATKMRLADRLSHHVSDARKGRLYPVAVWIRDLLARGKRPQIVMLIEHSCYSCEKAEIDRRVVAGESLLNVLGNKLVKARD